MSNKIKIFSSAILVLAVSIYIGFSFSNKDAIAATDDNEIMVYKSPTCGCCEKWVSHLERDGFNVTSKNMQNMDPIKKTIGVQRQYQSCHTAKIGKYFIEGHVPAADIKKLLNNKPGIKGLSVPGMVTGSPGMEGARKDPYNVLAIDTNNNYSVYSSY